MTSSKEVTQETVDDGTVVGVTTRSDWSNCIFCKNKSYKKDKKLHKIESEDRMKNILETARCKSDSAMEYLVSHEYFCDSARYHSACFTKYLLKTHTDNVKEETESSVHDLAFQKLISEIDTELMLNKKAFSMTNLLEIFRNFLPVDISSSYTANKLQIKLQKHYGQLIVIQPQQGQGKSNFIFSSSISVGDAIKAASQLKSDLKLVQMESEISDPYCSPSEEQILHTAANILRRDIQSLVIKN